jgi:acetate kinase
VGDVLVVNAGSTSLKLHLVHEDGSARRLDGLDGVRAEAAGHRIVHGGSRFVEPVLADDELLEQLEELSSLAPLHNGPALVALARARSELADVPHVAVFDTAFHATIPAEASTYAVPERWRQAWGIRRYGFHGLAVEWVAGSLRAARLVVCHLGGGCSVTAVLDGRSVDTTMGFSPLEGVPMATRSGSVDPGALLYLLRERGVTVEELDRALEHESGLFALGGTDDVRRLEGTLALDVYVHRIAAAVAAMAASLGGLDALVFTAGVGEGSAVVRERVCGRLGFLGVRLDDGLNGAGKPDADIGAIDSAVRIVVVAAREDVVAARAVRGLLEQSARPDRGPEPHEGSS